MKFQVEEIYLPGGLTGIAHGVIGRDLVPVVTTTEFWDDMADTSVVLDADQLDAVKAIVRDVFENCEDLEWLVENRDFWCLSADAVSEKNLAA